MRGDLTPFCESLVSAENSDAGTLKGQSIETHSSAPIHQNPAQGWQFTNINSKQPENDKSEPRQKENKVLYFYLNS